MVSISRFYLEPRTSIVISANKPVSITFKIRYPVWVDKGKLVIKVNNSPVSVEADSYGFVSIERKWKQGDRIDIELPMQTSIERLPDGSDYVAILHGPVVLAAKTSQENLTGLRAGEGRQAHIPNGPEISLNEAPILVTEDIDNLAQQIKPIPNKPMTFSAASVIQPTEYQQLELIPFFRVHDWRYMIYWRLASQ